MHRRRNVVALYIEDRLLQEGPRDDVISADGVHSFDDEFEVVDEIAVYRFLRL